MLLHRPFFRFPVQSLIFSLLLINDRFSIMSKVFEDLKRFESYGCNHRGTMAKIKEFIQKETVLAAAVVLALISMLIVPPDAGYADYIDMHTLAILFSLMAVMAGLRSQGVFDRMGRRLLSHTGSTLQLVLVLVGLCFFGSMFITNDVSLITFVPFTFIVLSNIGNDACKRLAVPVVCMQTIAANLGSMLTPIGNPQNLYLFSKSGMDMLQFVKLMLPYTFASLAMLVIWDALVCRRQRGVRVQSAAREDFRPSSIARNETMTMNKVRLGKDTDAPRSAVIAYKSEACDTPIQNRFLKPTSEIIDKENVTGRRITNMDICLFLVCLLAVIRVLPDWAAFAAVLVCTYCFDRHTLKAVDYSLLLTFVALFIFIGNLGRIPAFSSWICSILAGHEVLAAVLASQVTSNVPAALLLSGFTSKISSLIIGTNLGGLGTLIASMASLISFRQIIREQPENKGRYLKLFTVSNIVFLVILLALWRILQP